VKVKVSLRILVLLCLVVPLGAVYAALHMYSKGQQDAITVEIRAQAISNALSLYKRDSGILPKTLDLLVPKQIPAVGKCPDGTPFIYQSRDAGEYQLSCPSVFFGSKPYLYDSKSPSGLKANETVRVCTGRDFELECVFF
jgi:hypothetical protein